MNEQDIGNAIIRMQAQLDEVLRIVRGLEGKKKARAEAKRTQKKGVELSPAQTEALKATFVSLYERWLSGEDTSVQHELEAMDADQLRAIADANNLNVTTTTPKPKCIHLIGARFREKKQLTSGLIGSSQRK